MKSSESRMEDLLGRINAKGMFFNDIGSVRREFPNELQVALDEGLVYKREVKPPPGTDGLGTIMIDMTPAGRKRFLELMSLARRMGG